MGSFLALLFEFSSSPNYNFVMENFEIVYLSSLLNEKAGDFIQDELKKYGYPELKMPIRLITKLTVCGILSDKAGKSA